MKYKLLLSLTALLFAYIFFNKGYEKESLVLANDKGGYYLYLPAVFIYHDLAQLEFYKNIDSTYHMNGDNKMYAIYTHPATQRRFTKYSAGVAVCETPMFLLAHSYTLVTGSFTADGYTIPYRISILFSTIIFVLTGCWFLHRLLLRYFPDRVVFIVILLLLFGTNLYFYTAFDPGMSHPFSFGLFCLLLYTSDTWYTNGKLKHMLLTAAIAGLVVLVRPVNILMLMVPLCWRVYNANTIKGRLYFYNTHKASIIAGIILFFAVLCIQMAYWKYTTGHWIFFSYVDEGFHFSNPYIWNGLMSYRKGWYVYTPVAFIATLGFIPLWRSYKAFVPGLVLFFVVYVYVTFSWHQWWYGGSFGCRALIDILPVMALPLCAWLQWGLALRQKGLRPGLMTVLLFFIALNVFQAYQFSLGTIHWSDMNRAHYWHVFGKERATDDDMKLLKPQ